MGTHGSKANASGAQVQTVRYERLPIATVLFGGRGASSEELKKKRQIVRSFIDNAQAGDVYVTGGGIGSSGAQFEIVRFNRSKNKLGIKYINGRPVALSAINAQKYIQNGARLIKRG